MTGLAQAESVVIRRVQKWNPAIPDVANDFPAVATTTCFAAVFHRYAGQVAGRWGGLPAARVVAFVSAGGSGRGEEVLRSRPFRQEDERPDVALAALDQGSAVVRAASCHSKPEGLARRTIAPQPRPCARSRPVNHPPPPDGKRTGQDCRPAVQTKAQRTAPIDPRPCAHAFNGVRALYRWRVPWAVPAWPPEATSRYPARRSWPGRAWPGSDGR